MRTPGEIKVLVVEDDPFFQRVLQKRIAIDGYQVMVASDGREGMKAIVTFEPDLVISDWMMPQVDGLELCQSVKTGLRESAPYFILLTAKGEINDRLLGLETGADDYLVKPCDQVELVARVRAGIRVVALTQSLRRTVADLRAGNRPEEPAIRYCESCHRLDEGTGWMDLPFFLRERIGRPVVPDACPECSGKATDERKAA
jgi:DNA-binding response OmpR family regulator